MHLGCVFGSKHIWNRAAQQCAIDCNEKIEFRPHSDSFNCKWFPVFELTSWYVLSLQVVLRGVFFFFNLVKVKGNNSAGCRNKEYIMASQQWKYEYETKGICIKIKTCLESIYTVQSQLWDRRLCVHIVRLIILPINKQTNCKQRLNSIFLTVWYVLSLILYICI